MLFVPSADAVVYSALSPWLPGSHDNNMECKAGLLACSFSYRSVLDRDTFCLKFPFPHCLKFPPAFFVFCNHALQTEEGADPPAWTRNAKLGRFTNFVNLLDMCGVAIPSGLVSCDASQLPEVRLACLYAVR